VFIAIKQIGYIFIKKNVGAGVLLKEPNDSLKRINNFDVVSCRQPNGFELRHITMRLNFKD
jgi:hypothetical protein